VDDLFGAKKRIGLKFPGAKGSQYIGCKVLSFKSEEQKDQDTKEIVTWDDGSPKMQVVIELQVPGIIEKGDYDHNTEEWSPVEDDEGIRYLFCKGGLFTAMRNCMRQNKLKAPAIGSTLDIKHVSTRKPSKTGRNGAKVYEIEYHAPTEEDLFAV